MKKKSIVYSDLSKKQLVTLKELFLFFLDDLVNVLNTVLKINL